MTDWWDKWRKEEGGLASFTLVMLLLSLILFGFSFFLGLAIAANSSARGYLQKPNWFLFSLYWPIIAWLVHCTWHPFMEAWRSLPGKKVVKKSNGNTINTTVLDSFFNTLKRQRRWLICVALILGLGLTAWDAGRLWGEYGIVPVEVFCQEQNCEDPDFTVAFRLPNAFGDVNKHWNGLFVIFAYLMQGGLIFLALLTLFQVCLHTVSFIRFEKFPEVRKNELEITLNFRDLIYQFGLSEWNRAINYSYWAIAVGLLIPIISHASQEQGKPPDTGQILLQFLLPLLLLAPAALPVAGRFLRLRKVDDMIKTPEDAEL